MKSITRNIYKKGMTFIELIVVVSIFSVVAGVVLFNYRNFDTNIKVQNLAQDIALFVRTTQSEATSGVLSGVFIPGASYELSTPPAYGIFFSSEAPNRFDRFADFDPEDGVYNPPLGGITGICPSGECLERLTISDTSMGITNVCAVIGAGGEEDCGLDELHILFKRPFPTPEFVCIVNNPEPEELPCFGAKITIGSTDPDIAKHTIHIWNTGQISVE